MVTLLILFDFFNAFDSVNHGLLLRKLSSFQLSDPLLEWSDPIWQIALNALGDLATRTGGDAHLCRSTAGFSAPLLFAMFINDLRCSLRHISLCRWSANLYLHFPPAELSMALILIKEDISTVARWASNNFLTLNASKTKTILFRIVRNNIHGTATLNYLSMTLLSNSQIRLILASLLRALSTGLSMSRILSTKWTESCGT